MIKLLVWLAFIFGLVWALTVRKRQPGPTPSRQPASQLIVECAHCGLRVPVDEAITDAALYFCSEAHRRLGPH
jgi:uncharacterized protein